jgi:hypothetical protein
VIIKQEKDSHFISPLACDLESGKGVEEEWWKKAETAPIPPPQKKKIAALCEVA